MIVMNPKVDLFLGKAKKWQTEMHKIRAIVLGHPLNEELKWGKPCYTFQKSNVMIIYGLKEYCALGFLKGSLLKDAQGILVKPGENSQAARWIKFSEVHEIDKMEPVINAYIIEAIEIEKAGRTVDFKAKKELIFPEEFKRKLNEVPDLKKAFNALTPGRQRAYNLYFSAPVQSKTRESRIEKCMHKILKGKGLNDD